MALLELDSEWAFTDTTTEEKEPPSWIDREFERFAEPTSTSEPGTWEPTTKPAAFEPPQWLDRELAFMTEPEGQQRGFWVSGAEAGQVEFRRMKEMPTWEERGWPGAGRIMGPLPTPVRIEEPVSVIDWAPTPSPRPPQPPRPPGPVDQVSAVPATKKTAEQITEGLKQIFAAAPTIQPATIGGGAPSISIPGPAVVAAPPRAPSPLPVLLIVAGLGILAYWWYQRRKR